MYPNLYQVMIFIDQSWDRSPDSLIQTGGSDFPKKAETLVKIGLRSLHQTLKRTKPYVENPEDPLSNPKVEGMIYSRVAAVCQLH